MQPGKILLVANTDWYLYNFRLSLARFLQASGHEVVMVAPGGPYIHEIEKEGFRCVEWRVGRRTVLPLGELQAIHNIFRIYQKEKPRLVHHFTVKPVLYGALAARMAGVPRVVNSVTGLGYIFLKQGWQGKLLRLIVIPLYRFVLRKPGNWVVFENDSDRETFQQLKLIDAQASSVIHGVGVNAERFAPVPEPQEAPPLVVFPARMLLDKGVGTLVEAARILRGRVAVRIALVGEPDPGNPATVDIETLRAWSAEGLVEWWGFQRNMEQIYQNCHIVTLPSFGEGLPTVLIEAASCARPIITTDVPGCREVVTHGINGLLVPPGNPEELARALETLLTDAGLRARMGAAGRQIVLERFTDRLVIQKTYSVYQRMFAQPA